MSTNFKSRTQALVRAVALLTGVALGLVAGDAAAAAVYLQQGAFTGTGQAYLGSSVAVDGSTAIVGAPGDNGGLGAAYVYVFSGSSWSFQQELTASGGAIGDQFGSAVAISGNLALVAAGNKANAQSAGQGYVYSFSRSGATWTQQAAFSSTTNGATDGAANDCFGCSVALSGTTALVGAPQRAGNTGGAYLFTLSGSWQLQHEWVGANSNDGFGSSVALTPDAATAVVGAFGVSSQAGAAYVFTASGSWTTASQAVLTATGGQPGDQFGYSVAASPGTILVGAYGQSSVRGAAYVFTGSATSWAQQTVLTASDGVSKSASFFGDAFGAFVAMNGTTAVVGAPDKAGTAGNSTGATYFFNGNGSSWTQSEVTNPGPNQNFGTAVAVSGTTAVIGADSSVYIYAPSTAPVPALDAARVWALALLLAGAGALVIGRARTGRGVRT